MLSVRTEAELPMLCPLALTIQTVWLSTHPLSSSHPRNRPLILTLSKPLYCLGALKRKIFLSFLFQILQEEHSEGLVGKVGRGWALLGG